MRRAALPLLLVEMRLMEISLAGAGLACCIAGCAAVPSISTEETPVSFAAGPIEPTRRGVTSGDLVRPAGTTAVYRIVDGDDSGKILRESMRSPAPGADSGDALLREETRDGVLEERMELRRGGDGTISLEKVHTFAERSQSWFQPSLPFARDLAADGRLTGGSDMKVYAIPAGKPRAKGTATRSLDIAGECDVTVLGERMRALVLNLRFTVRLDVAHADVDSQLYVVPGRGIVAERRTEKRTILGILSSRSSETVVLERVHAQGHDQP